MPIEFQRSHTADPQDVHTVEADVIRDHPSGYGQVVVAIKGQKISKSEARRLGILKDVDVTPVVTAVDKAPASKARRRPVTDK